MTSIPSWFVSFFDQAADTASSSSGEPADASVSIIGSAIAPTIGQTVTFTVTAGNNGPGTASSLGISVPLGSAFSNVSAVTSTGSYDTTSGLWTVGNVADSTKAVLTITATVAASGWNPVTATIVADGAIDTNSANNIATAGLFVPPSGVTQPINAVTSTDGSNVAPAVAGSYNTEIISAPAQNALIILQQGYQSAVIEGSAAATLVDAGSGSALLVGGSGNDTLLAAAGNDTLDAGAGNNFIVSFVGTATISAAGQSGDNVFWSNGAASIQGGNGHDTAVMGGGVINTGTGGSQVWLGSGSTVVNSNGADTIVGGAGAETVNVLGSSGDLAFGGSGQMLFEGNMAAGSGANTVVGFNGSITVNGGAGGGLFFGGTAGNNLLNSGGGQADLFGGGNGDVLNATGSSNDVLVASSGAETLNAAGSSGSDAFFGGFGNDLMIGGTGVNAFTAGPGSMTLVGGGATDVYNFIAGATSNTVIQGFSSANDFITLTGFASGAAQAALSGETVSAAGTTIGLTDGTRITFAGLSPSQLTTVNFI
jgi:uncharacterized repeat protein (TIGR01451 family)